MTDPAQTAPAATAEDSVTLRQWDRLILGLMRVATSLSHGLAIVRFRKIIGYWPDPVVPQTYQEKQLWRRIFDRNPYFMLMCSKLDTKALLETRMQDAAPLPTTWTGQSAFDIPAALMEEDFVLKANVGSGSNLVVRANDTPPSELEARWQHWQKVRKWRAWREWGYRGAPQALLIEPFVTLGGGDLPTDIKVYVVNGHALCAWTADKIGKRSTTYDEAGRPLPERGTQHPGDAQALPATPENIALVARAMALAPTAAGDVDLVRVDFLVTKNGLSVGELTPYSDGGHDRIANRRVNDLIGAQWDLTRSHFLRTEQRGWRRLYAEALLRRLAPQPTS